ncbi:MAG: pyruvoyl-dependent arginine decarboxylase, partial [Muribaculaceae bacterium]|nr:pyruvoyl-dependent arginine decarboxylase [Muribaculaceae bacterium]
KDGVFVGGYAAEYVQFYDSRIDDEIAGAEARMWLTKSLKHELSIRGMEQDGDMELYHNFLNIPPDNPFGYCLTAIGFLNFGYAPLAK